MMSLGCVVVGVEPDRPSASVLTAAADEAERRNTALAVVTVEPATTHRSGAPAPVPPGYRDDDTGLAQVLESLRSRRPRLSLTTYQLRYDEVGSNREPLSSAALLVLSTHDPSGATVFSPETVSWRLFRAARSPVLIVRPQAPDGDVRPRNRYGHRPVVLAGLSGRRSDPVVISTAYAETQRRDADLHLLHAFALSRSETFEQALLRAMEVVARATRSTAPPVPTSVTLAQDEPSAALCRQAEQAAVLVMAARSGSMAGLISPSVSRHVCAAVKCPVLIVPWLLIDQKRQLTTTVATAPRLPGSAASPGG